MNGIINLKKFNIVWKIIGIGTVTFFSLFSYFFKGGLLEQHHSLIMFWGFILVALLCGLLISDFFKIVRQNQQQIEGLIGLELTLTSLIDLKDRYTEGHSRSVRDLTKHFGEFLKLSPDKLEQITIAAELHDIGKIGILEHILLKTEKLNEEEYSEIKKHPVLGAKSIKSLNGFETISNLIRHHHERYDGTGYPDGLVKEQIPRGSRIISIIDTYDAFVHDRSYRKGVPQKETLKIMNEKKGTHFDPELLDLFMVFIKTGKQYFQNDPVCGISLNRTTEIFKSKYNHQTYFFCSKVCLDKFLDFPEKYIRK